MATRERRRFLKQALAARLWGLAGSASLEKRRLVLTAVNPSVTEARDTEIVVRGARIDSARASVLSGDRIQAPNSFDQPNALTPRSGEATPSGGRLVYSFPPASIVRLVCDLAWRGGGSQSGGSALRASRSGSFRTSQTSSRTIVSPFAVV